MKLGIPIVVGLVLVLSGHAGPVGARQELSRADADEMARKVTSIYERGLLPPVAGQPPPPPSRVSFTEPEANAYFKHYGPEFMPAGVVNPRVRIGEANRVTATATVDLDAVRTARERGWLDPLAYVTGAVEVQAIAKLHAANGVAVVELERATLGGVAVSRTLLQSLISYYTATPDDPDGYQLGEPGPLPSGIVAVELRPGRATVVQ